jgi:hypothetical protein
MSRIISDESLNYNLLEFFDSLSYYLSDKFNEKWKYKYSEILISSFRDILINSLKKNRPVKFKSLVNRLKKSTGLNQEILEEFLEETSAKEELFPIIL